MIIKNLGAFSSPPPPTQSPSTRKWHSKCNYWKGDFCVLLFSRCVVLECWKRKKHPASFSGIWSGNFFWFDWNQRWQRTRFLTFGQVAAVGTKMDVIRQLEQTVGYNIKEIKFLSFHSQFLGLRNSEKKIEKAYSMWHQVSKTFTHTQLSMQSVWNELLSKSDCLHVWTNRWIIS